jgi:serine/threonine protein kinase
MLETDELHAGRTLGSYELLVPLARGATASVWAARTTGSALEKIVAVKAMLTDFVDEIDAESMFLDEARLISRIRHPNVVAVLDFGEAGEALYIVMEFIDGEPLQVLMKEARARGIPLPLAVRIVTQAALGLHASHEVCDERGKPVNLVHRDVSPQNLLITYDGSVKVIDFGVAKAVQQRLTDKTLFTQFGALVGTFEYMSPEQAELNAFGVDPRSDIYALGVLLYELLTGTTPLERTRLRAAALDEMVRLIREEEAPRPSVWLSSSNNLPKIAAARKTEPAQLSKLVRGEIDWIVMKCLEKDRSRRYDAASGLAKDIKRYLTDEPVEACPPSARYRLRKFARKYKKALATATAFAVLLVAGMVLSTLLAVWAMSEKREANRQRIASEEAKQEAGQARDEADKQRDAADQQRDAARLTAYASAWDWP